MTREKPLRVQPGPFNYYCYPGALEQLESFFTVGELENAFYLAGDRAGAAAGPRLPEVCRRARHHRRFTGHCTHETVDALAAGLPPQTPLVVGAGGGSALDTAKALAVKTGLPFAAVPTIAATCAAVTPLSVWYDPAGQALGFEVFRRAADLTLVDPRIILEAPAEYLKAGLADTLAKWYEADILIKAAEAKGEKIPLTARLGLEIAAGLRDTLLNEGAAAFRAMEARELTAAFTEVVDAIIIGGGLVGGLGERYTRVAAAHAVHNGLSALSETRPLLHGIKVAYGILVQAALYAAAEGDAGRAELTALLKKFRELGLPRSLKDLGVDASNAGREKIRRFVEAAVIPTESIHLLPFPVDAALLQQAVELLETAAAEN